MSGKNTGTHDFSGQNGYDNPSTSVEGQGGVRVEKKTQHGKHDGNGGSVKIISPSAVHGSNR